MDKDTIDCPTCGITNPSFELWCISCDGELHPKVTDKDLLIKKHVIKAV